MDFIDELKQLAKRVETLKDQVKTEEATKHSLVLPFIQLLGYDVFDPTEVIPEYTADVGTKKGEKVDYAIIVRGKLAILIEAKPFGDPLSAHDTQLFRYFTTSEAKFAILTNGALYKFYSDLQEPNKMDTAPFLEFDMLNVKEAMVPEIKKFHKETFDSEALYSDAANLKYMGRIRKIMERELKEPGPDLCRLLLKEVQPGKLVTQPTLAAFQPLVKRAIAVHINEMVGDRLKTAIASTEEVAPWISLMN